MRLINTLKALLLGSVFLFTTLFAALYTTQVIAKPAVNLNADIKTLEKRLETNQLNSKRQLISFEAEHCPFCKKFKKDVLNGWDSDVPIIKTYNTNPPKGWKLKKALFATPTIVLFENEQEVSRYTGYNGEKERFWKWLGFQLLTPAQKKIAFESGTERPFTGSNLDETRPGRFVDPITGKTLF